MCGRYYINDGDPVIAEIIAQVEEQQPGAKGEMHTGEIFPTNIVPVLTAQEPMLAKWGFTKYNGKGRIINARCETAVEKPTFRKPLLENRCLIPATNYFEWQKTGAQKQKTALMLPEKQPLFMAGFFRREKDIPYPVFVIMTREAGHTISHIHDRMPVILPRELHRQWLAHDLNLDYVLSGAISEGLLYRPLQS